MAAFPEHLSAAQRVPDALAELGELTKDEGANIIKLPNISASVPQLIEAITELQSQGYDIPNYPEEPASDEQERIHQRYSLVLGSAVNPVLREGNSDRRAPASVKAFARKHPHSMDKWSQASSTHVAHMRSGDFYHSEKSVTVEKAGNLKIELIQNDGTVSVLRDAVAVDDGEVVDAMFMDVAALRAFLEEEYEGALRAGLLASLHMKATMMKVSDPIIFGHAVEVYYQKAFDKHRATFDELGINPNLGLASVLEQSAHTDLLAAQRNRSGSPRLPRTPTWLGHG